MPFTVSHAAAVLPLHRLSNHKLPLTALMVGSMAPDFGYIYSLRGEPRPDAQHSGAVHLRLAGGTARVALLRRDAREGDDHAAIRPLAHAVRTHRCDHALDSSRARPSPSCWAPSLIFSGTPSRIAEPS